MPPAAADDLDELLPDAPPLDAGGSGPIEVVIEAGAAPERLDAALARRVEALSRSRLKTLISEGRVSSGGETLGDPSRRVNAGTVIRIDVPEAVPAIP
eukprot:gene21755-22714_t